jgi:hypothetical protein
VISHPTSEIKAISVERRDLGMNINEKGERKRKGHENRRIKRPRFGLSCRVRPGS